MCIRWICEHCLREKANEKCNCLYWFSIKGENTKSFMENCDFSLDEMNFFRELQTNTGHIQSLEFSCPQKMCDQILSYDEFGNHVHEKTDGN